MGVGKKKILSKNQKTKSKKDARKHKGNTRYVIREKSRKTRKYARNQGKRMNRERKKKEQERAHEWFFLIYSRTHEHIILGRICSLS